MWKQRFRSTAWLWIGLLAAVWLFQLHAVLGLVLAVAAGAIVELSALLKFSRKERLWNIGLSMAFLSLFYLNSRYGWRLEDGLYVVAFAALVHGYFWANKNARALVLSLFVFEYVTLNLHFFFKIAALFQWKTNTLALLVWIVWVTKLTDIGGLCVGCLWGKHLLLPKISPKKTWEGLAGGILFSLIGGMAFYGLFLQSFSEKFPAGYAILTIIALAWGAVVSDLIESLLKRYYQCKDSGSIISGIGGVLDLIDSLLLNAPLAYVFLKHFA